MREKVTYQDLTVQGIAGTYVIMIGFDMVEADCNEQPRRKRTGYRNWEFQIVCRS
jgi:hypothetical protein